MTTLDVHLTRINISIHTQQPIRSIYTVKIHQKYMSAVGFRQIVISSACTEFILFCFYIGQKCVEVLFVWLHTYIIQDRKTEV